MTPLIRVCHKCGTEIPGDAPEGGCPSCLAQTALDAAGGQKVFGRYTLVKVLGRGGMAIVWLARDVELERDVALKFLPDLMIQDRSAFDQLRRETKRCLELTHPHIVRIHDFVHDERSGGISMEYIDGETLSNLRADKEQRVFEPDEIATWITQFCDALDYAHNRADVIHCDLKPANLMVNQRGDLKITDFGIARSLSDPATRLTSEQGRSGTLVYMSPQQLSGERSTHFDDIYSLGATIYELLTSKPPFYSGNIDRQICERVPPSMTDRRKELDIEPALVPKVWEDVVADCLAKDPSRRPQSAVAVAERLQLSSRQTRIRPTLGKTSKKKPLAIAAIAAISALVLAGAYFGASRRHLTPVSHAPAIPEKSIAVLPFENRSEEKANAYFAEGIQDEILTRLSKIADLKVISRTSTQHYESAPENLPEIARQLGVAHILEGSVQKIGDAVRVNVKLINAATDSHLWADTFDRKLTDIFAVESEVAENIAARLTSKLSPEERAAIQEPPTHDIVAYDLYVRGKILVDALSFNDVRANEDLLEAVKLFEQAVSHDPGFFLAYYQLARAHDEIYSFGIDHTPSRLALAESALQAVVRLRPNSGEAHLATAQHRYMAFRDYDRAREELAIARHALPNEPFAFVLTAFIDRRQGRWEDSTKELERALELDPRNTYILQQLSFNYHDQRRFKEMIAVLDRVLALTPKDDNTRLKRGEAELDWRGNSLPLHSVIQAILAEDPGAAAAVSHRWIFLALCERDAVAAERALSSLPADGCRVGSLGFPRAWCEGLVARARGDDSSARSAFVRARAEVEPVVRQQPDYAEELCVLGMIDAALGRKADAIREGCRAVEILPITKDAIDGAVMTQYLAVIYAWTSEKKLALEQLANVVRVPSDVSYGYLRLDPLWDPLKDEPGFEKIVASLAPDASQQ
jgi:serine/threonine protein kinase